MENEKKEVVNGWGVVMEVRVRRGTKDGWWEMMVKKEDGSVVKMIGKKVNRFWSERDEDEL